MQTAIVLLQQFRLALVHHHDGAPDGTDVDRHVVQIEHQHRSANQYAGVGPLSVIAQMRGHAVSRGNLSLLNHSGQYSRLPV